MNKVEEMQKEQIGEEVPDWSNTGAKMLVYNVPISMLYYNDDNGRIATFVSRDKELNPNIDYKNLDRKEYNDKMHKFVKEANNASSFKKTKGDIKIKGQIKPGVILSDGRVVSGNRRFTVLRELYEDTGSDKFSVFKCFIIDKDLGSAQDRKYIKTIERMTQFGVDEKVEYDPVERLVDIYKDLVAPDHMWEFEEYEKKFNCKKNELKKLYTASIIMIDFLEYVNKPFKFHYAKTKKIDGPVQELTTLYNKLDKAEWNRIKSLFYSSLNSPGDRTRGVRDLIKVYKSNKCEYNLILQKHLDSLQDREIEAITTLKEVPKTDVIKTEGEISTNPVESDNVYVDIDISRKVEAEIFLAKGKVEEENKRKTKVNNLIKSLDTILTSTDEVFFMANEEEKRTINDKIKNLKVKLAEIEGK